MSKRTTRRPELFNDPDGTCCVRVPLGDGHSFAELYADDYAALLARGVSGNWQITVPNRLSRKRARRYVQCHVTITPAEPGGRPWTALTVARLIVDAPRGRKVTYRDDNTLNLRRDNLELADGYTRLDREALLPGRDDSSILATVGVRA